MPDRPRLLLIGPPDGPLDGALDGARLADHPPGQRGHVEVDAWSAEPHPGHRPVDHLADPATRAASTALRGEIHRSYLAALTAGHVLWSGMVVMRESVGGLMDAAPAAIIVERIVADWP